MYIVGDMKKSEDTPEGFVFKEFAATVIAISNAEGAVYLIIGNDSAYEAFTEYYTDDVLVNIK